MQEATLVDPTARQQWSTHNIIDMPHTVAACMHKIFSIFHEEMLQQNMHTTDHWYRYTLYTTYLCLCTNFTNFSFILILYHFFYRYEWQHHGSAHIHGFLWLDGAPNMETLNWQDPDQINTAKSFFNKYVATWNPRYNHDAHIHAHQSIEDETFLLDTKDILSSNPLHDYEQLLNRVQRHTKCPEKSCLRRKGNTLECRYKCPWKVQNESSLYINEKLQKNISYNTQ